jgi:GNAT superfamily N-acetyltransferase
MRCRRRADVAGELDATMAARPRVAGAGVGVCARIARHMDYEIRQASLADRGELTLLIERSARQLGLTHYSPAQLDGALSGAFGVDTQLIRDESYFVAETSSKLIGCGGFSYRRTLFGGDAHGARDAALLEPGKDAAKIRAFFVDPAYARRGIARALLGRCEAGALALGFVRFELMATLPGVEFYRSQGYSAGALIEHEVAPGLAIGFVPMHKP